LDKAITTLGVPTVFDTVVVVVLIAIIAFLHRYLPSFVCGDPQNAVTASSAQTRICAIISGLLIAVIAGFVAWFSLRSVKALNAIATQRCNTTCSTGIIIIRIAIITGFEALVPRRQILPGDGVTTTGFFAVIQTTISGRAIAVITGFAPIKNAITASGQFL
jgi:hypothetical protein